MEPTQAELDAYNELQAYTLGRGGAEFIHQHVVDAWIAQHADERTKPIGIAFALVGLYLHVERKLSGRQVQLAHIALAKNKQTWPSFSLPADRGALSAAQVMAAPPGPERDRAIDAWCVSVWDAFRVNRESVALLLKDQGVAGTAP